jgi:hypothetical protein
MTPSEFQRAMLAQFALRAAGEGASGEQARAIAICVRNRVKLGMFDSILRAVEESEQYEANLPSMRVKLDLENRTTQRFIRDIDDVYFDNRDPNNKPEALSSDLMDSLGKSVFWGFLNQPFTPWFRENVIDNPDLHPMRCQMGLMMFYE